MRYGPILLATAAVALPSLSSLGGQSFIYVVKEGDTLTEIVSREVKGTTWGSHGNLAKTLKLNPWIKNPQLIRPDDRIQLESEPLRMPASEKTEVPPTDPELKASVDTQKMSESAQSDLFLLLLPQYSATTLHSRSLTTQASAQVASQLHLSITGQLAQKWTERFQTFIRLGFGYISFEEPSDPGKSIAGRTKLLSGGGIGAEYRPNPKFTLTAAIDDRKELFVKSGSTTSLGIDAVRVPILSLEGSFKFFQLRRFHTGVSLLTAINLPTSTDAYSIGVGSSYGGRIYLGHESSQPSLQNFQAEIGFNERRQNTSLFIQSESSLFMQLKFPMEIK